MLGLTVVPVVCPILAIYFGLSGRRRIAHDGTEGKGLADAGLVLGIVGLAITLYFSYIVYTRVISPPVPPVPPG